MTGEQLHRRGIAAHDIMGTTFPVDLCFGRKCQDSILMRNPMVGLQDPLDFFYRALGPTCFSRTIRGPSGHYRIWLHQVKVTGTWSSTLFLGHISHREGKSL